MGHHESHHIPVEHEHPDQWHHHSSDEGVPQAEHGAIASPGLLFRSWIVICAVVAGVVLILALYFGSFNEQYKHEQMETVVLSNDFNVYKSKSEDTLNGYGWADATAGAVRVPIDHAMERVIAKYKKVPTGK